MLAVVLFLPLIGAVALFAIRKSNDRLIKVTALAVTLATFACSIPLFLDYDVSSAELFQLGEDWEWIPSHGIRFSIGVDGISLTMLMLVTFLGPIVVLGSVKSIGFRQRDFYALILCLESFMLGAFVARDLFLFYLFWELMVVPMYFIIGVWGGPPRVYAAMKFFIYTLCGSLPMMAAVIYLYMRLRDAVGPEATYSIEALGALDLSSKEQWLCFLAFGLSFAIKVPLFPFHTWLPDAHTEAPTPGSVVLAGVLLKMGGYGFIRFAIPFFPEAVQDALPYMYFLGVVGIIFAALVALVQEDVKRLVAYSSVSHMGLVILGIFSINTEGITGSVYQMLGHGLTTGGLFLLIGMLYERRHTRQFSEFGGLAAPMPFFALFFVLVTLGSVGLPGLVGFVGEFLIFKGTFAESPVTAFAAVTGMVLGAWYMLLAVKKIFFGAINNPANEDLRDLDFREICVMLPLAAAIILLGIFPGLFLDRMGPSVQAIIENYMTTIGR